MKKPGKFRMTHQRRVILEEIQNAGEHLSADEIYERVRRRLPKISMGTVYRNLDILASRGLVWKLGPDHPQMLFDGNTEKHYHLLCMRCGKVTDAEIDRFEENFESLEEILGRLTRYGIFGHKLEFLGLCDSCREKEKDLPEDQRLPMGQNGL